MMELPENRWSFDSNTHVLCVCRIDVDLISHDPWTILFQHHKYCPSGLDDGADGRDLVILLSPRFVETEASHFTMLIQVKCMDNKS
jgi:hypothetical protein